MHTNFNKAFLQYFNKLLIEIPRNTQCKSVMPLTDHVFNIQNHALLDTLQNFHYKLRSYAYTNILAYYSLAHYTIVKYWDKVNSLCYDAETNKIFISWQPNVKYSDLNSNLDDDIKHRYQTLIQSPLTLPNMEYELSA